MSAPWPPSPVLPRRPSAPRWSAQPHDRAQPYLHLLRTRHHRWWKSLLGLVAAVALFGVFQVVVGGLLLAHVLVTGGSEKDFERLLDDAASPSVLLLTNLTLASLIPITAVVVLVVHQERVGWLFSVLGRLRWGLLARYAALAVALMVASLGIGAVLPAGAGGGLPEWHPPPDGRLVLLAAVFLLTTPLQAAGEEFFFRGYLAQAIASWIPPRVAALLVTAPLTATLFALAHGTQDPWLFADRFAFGIAAAVLVWLTGGLEASIALHTVNNLAAFAVSTLSGTLAASVLITEAPAGAVVLDIAALALFTAIVWVWTSRRPVRTRSDAPVADPFWSPG